MPPMQHPGPAKAKNPPAFLLHADIITAATGQVLYQTEGVVSSASRRLVVPDSVLQMLERARHPDVEARRFGTLGFDRFREVAASMARILRSRPGFLAEALEILEGSPLPELGNTGAPRSGREVDPALLEGIPEGEEQQGYAPTEPGDRSPTEEGDISLDEDEEREAVEARARAQEKAAAEENLLKYIGDA